MRLYLSYIIGDLMDAANTGNILARDVEDGTGHTPFVTASSVNNGVAAYIDASKYEIIEGNCILVGGKTFTLTYQKDGFVSNDSHNIVIRSKNKNTSKFHYLYLISILRATLDTKYFWGDAVTKEKLLKDSILLPQVSDGQPDWAYMERYMRAMERKAKEHIKDLLHETNDTMLRIDIGKWKSFRLDSLFDIVKGSRLTKQDMKEGEINYVSASSFNNGITNHVANDEHVHEGNALTVTYDGSDIGRSFYQEKRFWATDSVSVFRPLFSLNKYLALFMAPLIKAAGANYVYKDKWKLDDMKRAEIKLPVDADGQPDWAYMERYMQGIEADARKRLLSLGKATESA